MADLEKTIDIIFGAVDNASGTITGITANIDALGRRTASATQPLADLAASAVKLEAALAALVAGGLVLAFKASSDFEASSIELQKVIGDEIELLGKAEQSAKDLSGQYGQSASAILGSTADFKQAGFDISDSMILTKDAMDLVIAGNLEAGQASNLLISILKGFKAPATDARVALDILNSVSNNFATDVEQLAIGLGDLSPIARTMGFTMAETAGILTPVIEIFRSGSEAAVALKTGLLKLVSDNPKVISALESIGVAQTDATGALRSGKDILLDVATAFKTLDQNQKLFVAQQLVGINQAARMVEVFDGLSTSTAVTAVAMNSAGSAAEEVAVRLKSAQVAVDRFKESFTNLGIEVGEEFLDASKGAIDGATAINTALGSLADEGAFEPIFAEIRRFADRLNVNLVQIAQVMPDAFELIDWGPLIDSVKQLGTEVVGLFEAFFGDVDLSTAEGVATAIQKIVDTGESLTRIVGGILEAWQPFIASLSKGIDAINDSDEATKEFVGTIGGWAGVINTIASNTGILTGALNIFAIALSGKVTLGLIKSGAELVKMAAAVPGLLTALSALTKGAVAFGLGWTIGTVLRDNIPLVREMGDRLGELAFTIVNWGDDSLEAKEKQAQLTKQLGEQRVELARTLEAQGKLPSQQVSKVDLDWSQYKVEGDKLILYQAEEIPDEKELKVNAAIDEKQFSDTQATVGTFIETLEDGTTLIVHTGASNDAINSVQNKLDEVPSEKLIEIRAQGEIDTEIARITAQAETLQSQFEWSAKLDIAEVEANAEIVTTLAEGWASAFESTGDVITGALGALTGATGFESLRIEDLIRAESARRDLILANETKLTDAQVAYMNARTDAMARGQGLVTIQAEGLEPELELVLHRIIELTQIRANEEGLELLLGV